MYTTSETAADAPTPYTCKRPSVDCIVLTHVNILSNHVNIQFASIYPPTHAHTETHAAIYWKGQIHGVLTGRR